MLSTATKGFQCFVAKFTPELVDYYRTERYYFISTHCLM